MALIRISKKSDSATLFGITPTQCLHISNVKVGLENIPTDAASALSGSLWAVIIDTTNYTTANMTGAISSYFDCLGYDETNDTWSSITPASTNSWDISGYKYVMVRQFSSTASAGVYFT